jgi:predicted dehydrogenase
MMERMRANRRDFLIAGAAWTALSQSRVLGANDRLRVGAIGCGGRMRELMSAAAKSEGNEIVAVCDAYEPRRQQAITRFAAGAREYLDYHELLQRNDIDVVLIASPDHWHVPMTIDAVQAGKDVYIEKPVTHSLDEGPALAKAVNASGRIVQCGMQQRSWAHFRTGAEMIAAGKLGQVTLAQTYWFQNYLPHNKKPDIDTSKLDWKRWLGAAPERPFDPERFTTWRWYWDYGGGALTDLFTHWADVVHWAMRADTPKLAQTMGSQYAFPEWDCPDTIQAGFEYPNFMTTYEGTMICSVEDGGLVFKGSDATMRLDRARLRVFAERGTTREPIVDEPSQEDGTIAHMRNFFDCVRSRKQPNAPVETGIAAARAGHLGNLALRRGQRVRWPESSTL